MEAEIYMKILFACLGIIGCVIYPGLYTSVVALIIFVLILFEKRAEKRIPLIFLLLIPLASFSLTGATPGASAGWGKISIGNVMLLLLIIFEIIRLPLKQHFGGERNPRIVAETHALWIVFFFYGVLGFLLQHPRGYFLKELNQWSYFLGLLPIVLIQFRELHAEDKSAVFRTVMSYAFLANLILFSYGLYGALLGKTSTYLGWLDPIAAGRVLPPTWRTWKIAYGAALFAIPMGVFAVCNLLESRTSSKTSSREQDGRSQRRKKEKTYWFAVLVLSCLIAGFSGSRTFIISLAASFFIAIIYIPGTNRNRLRVYMVVGLIALIAIASAMILSRQRTASGENLNPTELFALHNVEETYRISESTAVFQAAVRDKFLGEGAGGAFVLDNISLGTGDYERWMPHNLTLYLLLKVGVLGLVLFYGLWLTILRYLWVARTEACDCGKTRLMQWGSNTFAYCTIFSTAISAIILSQFGPELVSIHGFILTSLFIAMMYGSWTERAVA